MRGNPGQRTPSGPQISPFYPLNTLFSPTMQITAPRGTLPVFYLAVSFLRKVGFRCDWGDARRSSVSDEGVGGCIVSPKTRTSNISPSSPPPRHIAAPNGSPSMAFCPQITIPLSMGASEFFALPTWCDPVRLHSASSLAPQMPHECILPHFTITYFRIQYGDTFTNIVILFSYIQ